MPAMQSRRKARRTVAARCAVSLIALATVCPQAWAQNAASAAATIDATAKEVASSALAGAQRLASFALSLIGVDYKWGGTRPETGLDCSGLVQYVFQEVTGVTLPRTAHQMSRLGERVSASDLKPGDLVFFNTRRFAFSHVGIYLGDNRFIHAPARGREVQIAEFDAGYWKKRFNGARRLAGLVPELLAPLVAEAAAATPAPGADAEQQALEP
jgi:cell wall-associated NlpC family hydrolase